MCSKIVSLQFQLYSGFFKHEVEGSGLCGAVSMISAMGYKPDVGNEVAPNTYVLDGPVCPDQVAAVSRDSLIAYVECQVCYGSRCWRQFLKRLLLFHVLFSDYDSNMGRGCFTWRKL